MIRLHTAQTPNGHKIAIALEELGVPYETHWVHRDQEAQLKPEFPSRNPTHHITATQHNWKEVWSAGGRRMPQ